MHNPEPCLIRVDADDGTLPGGELVPFLADVFKLSIAHSSRWRVLVSRFQRLVIYPQRESHLSQQAPHCFGADANAQAS